MNAIDKKTIKTKEDVKQLFKKIIDDKNAWIECVRAWRLVSELEKRGIKTAKLGDVLGWVIINDSILCISLMFYGLSLVSY